MTSGKEYGTDLVLIFVQIDLSRADLALFEEYEAQALALLPKHGATLEVRLRSADGSREVHLLNFPDASALEAFRADPARAALHDLWQRCGATSAPTEVTRLS